MRQIHLENGLVVSIFNNSHRYFGDYHRVRVDIRCEVPLAEEIFATKEEFDHARRVLGISVTFHRSFEQMGVATAEVEGAVDKIIENFRHNAMTYIASTAFPGKLVRSELAKGGRTPARTYHGR